MVLEEISITSENFEIIQPVILVARFFGILPIQYIKQGGCYKLKQSVTHAVYSYILTVVLIGLTLLGVIDDLDKDEQHSVRMKDRKSRYVTCGDISIVILIVVFGTLTLPLKLKELWKFLQCLNQVDSIIPLIKPKKFRKASVYFMTATYITTTSVIIFDVSVWAKSILNRTNDVSSFFRNYVAYYVLYLVIMSQEVLFWHLIFFVKIRISALNKQIRCLGNENLVRLRKRYSLETLGSKVKVEGYPASKIESGKQLGGLEKKDTINNMGLADTVTSLMKLQEKIYTAVQSINNCSAYGIHLITLSCLLHLIVTPYFLLTEVMKESRSLLFIVLQSVWLLTHIGRLLIIVEPCQQCLNEHERALILLCELLIGNFDDSIKNSLTIFAMQLNYCKIKFSYCGFFKINRSLLTTMAGAVTTYLVILYQFTT